MDPSSYIWERTEEQISHFTRVRVTRTTKHIDQVTTGRVGGTYWSCSTGKVSGTAKEIGQVTETNTVNRTTENIGQGT